jgi:hypothetical protein
MNKHNRPSLPESQVIDLRGRRVGTEDFNTAATMLQWAEQAGYRGTSLKIAANVAQGLRVAVELSEKGQHEAAAKQAGNCLWVLKKDRGNAQTANHRALGSMVIDCRDGQKRAIGQIVEWFTGVHFRIHEQILEAKAAEDEALATAELEALQYAASVAQGQSIAQDAADKAKAA